MIFTPFLLITLSRLQLSSEGMCCTWRNVRGPTQERSFLSKCPKFAKSSSIASHLKEHEGTHTGEKPFKWTKCDEIFIKLQENQWKDPLRRDSFQVHTVWHDLLNIKLLGDTRDHTGEKPLKCTETSVFNNQVSWRSMKWLTTQDWSLLNAQSVTRAS